MTDYPGLEQNLSTNLQLRRRPIAIAFRDAPPTGVEKFSGTEPSGCSFWRVASAGRTFYTVPSDHYNCPIGAYTHNIPLPAERAHELDQTLSLMAKVGYIRMEEVAGIPRLPRSPAAVVYAPLGDTPVDPDVVVIWGNAASIMLLEEAALRASVSSQLQALSRPTCMAVSAAMSAGLVASTACVGNRVYTGAQDGEMFAMLRGSDVARVAAEAGTIASANAALFDYHVERRSLIRE
jgi:uncharacterized protein (DUF169 family)